jgi:hypothetical protein
MVKLNFSSAARSWLSVAVTVNSTSMSSSSGSLIVNVSVYLSSVPSTSLVATLIRLSSDSTLIVSSDAGVSGSAIVS